MIRFTKPVTADEAMRILSRDPDWVAMRREQDLKAAEQEIRLSKIEETLLSDLEKVGIRVRSVWDLVNTNASYEPAMPLLLIHLRKPYPSVTLEGISRALGVREALPHWNELVELYRSAPSGSNEFDEGLPTGDMKCGIAVALSAIATRRQYDEVAALAQDPNLGFSRAYLLDRLSRFNDVRSWAIIQGLADDRTIGNTAKELIKNKAQRERRKQLRAEKRKA